MKVEVTLSVGKKENAAEGTVEVNMLKVHGICMWRFPYDLSRNLRHLNTCPHRDGKVAQWLRTLFSFPEDPGSILSNHIAGYNCL